MSELVSDDVELAARRLLAGGLVAMPTETVYGLAADATNAAAVARVFEVKGRPVDHPLIVHLASGDDLDAHAVEVPSAARVLATACWPGPLTMLLRRGPGVLDVVTGGRPTVGLRVPSHPVAQRLLAAVGTGVAAPSANRFGRVSPTTAQHVADDIGHLLDPERDLILDGGPSEVGVESTIVDLTRLPPQILRHGAITDDDIARLLATPVAPPSGPSRASGMLDSHYAPACDVIAVETPEDAETHRLQRSRNGERVDVLDRTGDLVAAARSLYGDLRSADERGLDALVVVLPPAEGLGHALRDRITKAAAARPGHSSPAG